MGESESLKHFLVGKLPTVIYIPDFITASEQAQLLGQIYQAPASKWKTLKNRRLQNWGGVVHEKGLLPQACKWCLSDAFGLFAPCIIPPWLLKITEQIREQTGLFPSKINHVLINEYLPEQGIMLHQDGPAYFPTVAILSLGSPVVMNFSPHPRLKECPNNSEQSSLGFSPNMTCGDQTNSFSVFLMPCSLLIFKDSAYSDFLHGIEDKNVHNLDKVINVLEAQKLQGRDVLTISEDMTRKEVAENQGTMIRTETRVSLTCRLVLKVHKNILKFQSS